MGRELVFELRSPAAKLCKVMICRDADGGRAATIVWGSEEQKISYRRVGEHIAQLLGDAPQSISFYTPLQTLCAVTYLLEDAGEWLWWVEKQGARPPRLEPELGEALQGCIDALGEEHRYSAGHTYAAMRI